MGRRESHDATAFYERFVPKLITDDTTVHGPVDLPDPLVLGDARRMDLPDNSVALVVTSPPYFAGKAYEEDLDAVGVPSSYVEYLELLRDVFAECARVLEPGGRIAVNVANLGRKPFRSLAGDVTRILDEELGLLLRGEVVWIKGDGASGSCAWGSFRSAANPVLRDTTERVVIASKGRFDRALSYDERRSRGLPYRSTLGTDEFLDATLDVWRIAPESARRIGHPAPFPVELPQRLIDLYTFEGDLVLDPFLGSGTTAVAAVRTGRRYVGYDLDPEYVRLAKSRIEEESGRSRPSGTGTGTATARRSRRRAAVTSTAQLEPASPVEIEIDRTLAFPKAVAGFLEALGNEIAETNRVVAGVGLTVDLVATGPDGLPWEILTEGAFSITNAGLTRRETLLKTAGTIAAIAATTGRPVTVVTSRAPSRRSHGDRILRTLGPAVLFDLIDVTSRSDLDRLSRYATASSGPASEPGFWTPAELARAGHAARTTPPPAPRRRPRA